ncbi:MAG: DUF4911 domain-containing protein [Proteobacteria bacterium]|nr:DUF4911 domain-containing protein [Pseudomonadota bacterium]
MKYLLTMDKRDIVFFCSILEVSERFAIVRTVDKTIPILELIVSPYYIKEIKELLELIGKSISFKILEEVND